MMYTMYAVVGVASFLAGWLVFRTSRKSDFTITLTTDITGKINKDLKPSDGQLFCGRDVSWDIFNATGKDVTVDLRGFKDKPSGKPKDPIRFQAKPISIPQGKTGSIKGKIKPKSMFGVPPKGIADGFGEFQDFQYSVAVDEETIDPEVRIRG